MGLPLVLVWVFGMDMEHCRNGFVYYCSCPAGVDDDQV
jgi:hypothetical protein